MELNRKTTPSVRVTSAQLAAMPSDLERAMESLIVVFHKYAAKEGSRNTLSRRELKDLMENELSGFLKSQKDPAAVDRIMKDLDSNGDGEVDFEEFVSLVVGLSIACEQCYQLHKKKMGK
ncbi:hypothetical protein DPEC_G00203900 [Dallia pectoralis]|uniref:Uncharacterized protein n=1 Tax=Dallia pectoralis TaxID=75939 RepID=A0ACC2G9N8_DALPE|nr:hypothetical protein DPEC_G00203900 [Dallia pectoralis]